MSGPTPIAGLETGVAEIAVGESQVCALMSSGAVKCFSFDGKSGEANAPSGGFSFPATPTDVMGLGPDVKAIASGDGFSCALLGSGTVQCWGNNVHGELGNGTQTGSAMPVKVNLPAPAVSISAAAATEACALLQTGKVMCWGSTADPPPGFDPGKVTDLRFLPNAPTPIEVSGFASDVVALTTGGECGMVCAVLKSGGVQCRGVGILGDGHDWGVSGKAVSVGGMTTAVEVKSNDGITCARLADGSIKCWGYLTEKPPGPGCTTLYGDICSALLPYDVGL